MFEAESICVNKIILNIILDMALHLKKSIGIIPLSYDSNYFRDREVIFDNCEMDDLFLTRMIKPEADKTCGNES